jgi:transposase
LASAREELNLTPDEPLEVYFQDEGIFGRMSNPVSCWAPQKIRPKLSSQRIRQYSYVYAALCPEMGDLCSLIMPYSNTDCMQIFLDEFARRRAGKPTVLIMDQAAWHKSPALKKYPNILITYQPPYSPELNPVEHLWKHLRTTFTHNWFWSSLDKLEDRLCEALLQLSKNPQTIKSFSFLIGWSIFESELV